jgi:hypothetical protein
MSPELDLNSAFILAIALGSVSREGSAWLMVFEDVKVQGRIYPLGQYKYKNWIYYK